MKYDFSYSLNEPSSEAARFFSASPLERRVRHLFCEWDSEVLANFPGKLVVDLGVTGYRRASVL